VSPEAPFDPKRRVASQSRWAYATLLLLALTIVLDCAAVFSMRAQISLLQRMEQASVVSEEDAAANDSLVTLVEGLRSLAVLAIAVTLITWMYKAYRNLLGFGARLLEYSPGWAIGCFFAPFLNLIRPYSVVAEIWKASVPGPDGTEWIQEKAPVMILLWWGFWLASNVVSWITLSLLSSRQDNVGALMVRSYFVLVADLLAIPAAAALIAVVHSVNQRQIRTGTKLSSPPLLATDGVDYS
jgi:hypothetical protein